MYLAVTLNNWEEVNEYFEQGWEYVYSYTTKRKINFVLSNDSEIKIKIIGNPIQMEKVN